MLHPFYAFPIHTGEDAINWDAIGAVGEMIGALAVVVTLAYLGVESEATQSSSAAGLIGEVRSRFMEHADVWVREMRVAN